MARCMAVIIGLLVVLAGCGHQAAFRPDEVSQGQTVSIQMTNGRSVEGTVVRIENDVLVVVDETNNSWRARKESIAAITGPEPVRDDWGTIIGERDIAAAKGNKNMWTYTISGALLSMGTSFFITSMASRSIDSDDRNPVLVGGTAAGTAVGAFLFSRLGARKDRQAAIATVNAQRRDTVKEEILLEKEKTESLQQQIEALKKQIQ